jgi:hypothetical protein
MQRPTATLILHLGYQTTYTTTDQLPETYKDLLPVTQEIAQRFLEQTQNKTL